MTKHIVYYQNELDFEDKNCNWISGRHRRTLPVVGMLLSRVAPRQNDQRTGFRFFFQVNQFYSFFKDFFKTINNQFYSFFKDFFKTINNQCYSFFKICFVKNYFTILSRFFAVKNNLTVSSSF